MNISRNLARLSTSSAFAQQRFATTDSVRRIRKAAAPPAPKQKALKTPSKTSVSAYALFVQQLAAERKKAGERFLLTDAAAAYKNLPEDEKAKLLEQIPALISQRKAIYEEFVSKLSPNEILNENKKRAQLRKERISAGKSVRNLAPILDKNAPTRPLGAYMLFVQEARQDIEYQGMSVVEQAKALGEKWRSLAQEEKVEFETQAKKLKDEYEEKKKEYYES